MLSHRTGLHTLIRYFKINNKVNDLYIQVIKNNF